VYNWLSVFLPMERGGLGGSSFSGVRVLWVWGSIGACLISGSYMVYI
jgi:hypothetical protein